MNCLLSFFLSLILLSPIQANGPESLSAESRLVQEAYLAYTAKPLSEKTQLNFLRAFPKSGVAFRRIFDEPNFGQLYETSINYISSLEKLSNRYPKQVLRLEITLGKNLVWSADAINHLQRITLTMAIVQPRLFAVEAAKLTPTEQQKLSEFLTGGAEREDLSCSQLVKELTKIGSVNLAKQLRQAQIRQMRQPE
ncbi:hypothetical protein [uncultured Hymenobacter sp.]|uniref:hypothetical protein n=1 Tax=uncultured Hymenobacter sp. TaxID=170016 RepID=UPI0035CA9B77